MGTATGRLTESVGRPNLQDIPRYSGGHDQRRYQRVIEGLHTHGLEGATSLSMEKAMVLVKTARAALRLPTGDPAEADALLLAYARGAWETDLFTADELQEIFGFEKQADVYYLLDLLEIDHRRGGRSRGRRLQAGYTPGSRQGQERRQFV